MEKRRPDADIGGDRRAGRRGRRCGAARGRLHEPRLQMAARGAAGAKRRYMRIFAGDHRARRLLEPIGNIPPAEAEARYYAQLEEPAIAA